ncbi:hypothetical protein [Mesorhizobium sp. M0220]|uniref:hypothetical protein n=1 Tax=unclassified Mesorhizobium TaxID=325217 RepID=UPI00333A51AD
MTMRDPQLTATEPTRQGEQMLIPGVRPITTRDRLTLLMDAPMRPRAAQTRSMKPAEINSTCSDKESFHDPDH